MEAKKRFISLKRKAMAYRQLIFIILALVLVAFLFYAVVRGLWKSVVP